MAKINDLKNIVLDAIMEFYQEYIKPESRQMMEEVLEEKLEEKFEEKLGPIKAAIISLEKNVSFALGDYQGQQIQVSDHEKRISSLEGKVLQS